MKIILIFLNAVLISFGYEINHENMGKFYKFQGDADGAKFELYLNFFDVEFENFKDSKHLIIPTKIYGHIFFNGSKYDFNKGSVDQNSTNINAINALSDWLNLDVKLEEDGKLKGKLAIKGKAHRAEISQDLSYEILALGVQIVDANGTKFEAIASEFFSADLNKKFKKSLEKKIKILKDKNIQNTEFNIANELVNLEFQNNKIKTICTTFSKSKKSCIVELLKGLKQIGLDDVFVNMEDENLKAIFSKKEIIPSENFSLTPIGITFYNENEKTIDLEEIKPYLKQNFGLFNE